MQKNIRAVAQEKIDAGDIKQQVLMECYNFVRDLQEMCDLKVIELVEMMWDNSGKPYPPHVRKELEDHGLLGD